MSKKSPARKIAKEATISIVGMGFGNTVRYIFTALLARWVGLEYLGIYSLANAVTRFAEVFGKAGMERGILRFVSMKKEPGKEDSIKKNIQSTLKIGSIFAFIVMAVQMLLSGWLVSTIFQSSSLLKTVIIVNAISLPFTVVTMIAAFATQGFKLLKYKVFVTNMLAPTVLLLTMITAYFLISSEMAIILPLLISAIVSFIIMLFFLKKLTGISLSQVFPADFNSEIIRFSYPLMFVTIIGTFMHWMDVTMLGYFTDAETVGLYYPAARSAGLLRAILLAFMSIFSPMLSELFAQEKRDEMSHLFKLVVRWILTLAVPFTIIFILFSKKVMLLFGGEYVQAANVLIVLTLATFIQSFIGAGGPALTMTGHPKVNLINSSIVVVINVILNILWIPKYGIIGAAWATLVSLSTLGIIRSVEVWFLIKLQPISWKLLKPVMSGCITYGLLFLMKPYLMPYHTLITLLISTVVTFLIFFGILWLLKLDSDDREVWSALLMITNFSKKK